MSQGYTLQTAVHAEVERTVREHLAAFERGSFDAWGANLAPNVFFTAADPEEVFSERGCAIAEMHKDFAPAFDEGLKLDIQSQSFHIGASFDGRVAWSATPLQYTVSFGGERTSFLIRHTDLLTKSDEQWSILVTQYSIALPESKALQAQANGHLPAPRMVGDAVMPGAESLVEEFTHQLDNLSSAVISQHVHAFGPLPGEHADGEAAVRQLFASWTSRWSALRLRPDGIRAELVFLHTGWVGANVEATVSYESQQIVLPMRLLVVYHKEQDIWAIVQAHLSVGVPDELAE
jgi:ketosteroid isomerase-like protein